MIKKITLLLAVLLLFIVPVFGFAQEKPEQGEAIHFFEDERCSTCAQEKEFLESEIKEEYPSVEIRSYIIENQEERSDFESLLNEKGFKDYTLMTPTTLIGDNLFIGFFEEDKSLIKRAIEGENVQHEIDQVRGEVDIPFVGRVDVEDWSLPFLAVVIGSLDGLNVCSIGALILILMIVLAFDSRKKIVFYGGLFILTAVIIYGTLVFAWTALFEALASFIGPLNIVIGIASLLGGVYFFYQFLKFLKYGPTCQSSSSKLANKATKKLKKSFNEKTEVLVLAGSVIFFAAIMTLVELPCSFGLPMVYGSILAESGLSWLGYGAYIVLYLFFYMLIELIIFAGAVITKEVWIAESNLITWVYLAGTIVLFFLSYYYLIGF
ncbi:MAG: hypothetical protein ACQEP3_00725 [Patescibacteria group bacterium]